MNEKLSEEYFAEIARKELKETETRKEQSLKQVREWILKHPFISNFHPGSLKIRLSQNSGSDGFSIIVSGLVLKTLYFLRITDIFVSRLKSWD